MTRFLPIGIVICSLLLCRALYGSVEYADNGVHEITTDIGEFANVRASTVVNVQDGAKIGLLLTYDTSTANIYAGEMQHLGGSDSSEINVYGGRCIFGFNASQNATINFRLPSGAPTFSSGEGSGASGNATLNFFSGGAGGGPLAAVDSARINVNGGGLGQLSLLDASSVRMTSGAIQDIYAYSSSNVSVEDGGIGFVTAWSASTISQSGGSINILTQYDTTTSNITGGNSQVILHDASSSNFSGGEGQLWLYDGATALVTGGLLSALSLSGSASATMTGGTIYGFALDGDTALTVSGGKIAVFSYLAPASEVTLVGYGLTKTPSYDLGSVAWRVSGILKDGTAIDVDVIAEGTGDNIILNNLQVPEVSSVVVWSVILLICYSAHAVSRRHIFNRDV